MSARRSIPHVVVVLAGCLVLTGCVAPSSAPGSAPESAVSPPVPTEARSGDEQLLRLIRPTFTDDHDRVAVAVIDADGVRTAFLGADESTVFEVGSITKAFTGELLAEAIDRGEVAPDDTLGEHLDLGEAPVASVTLRNLAAHLGGLPTFPTDPAWVERVSDDFQAGRDVIDETTEELLAQARALEVRPEQGFTYSNIGAALLGQALAAAAGTDYRTLLSDRILDPLGMKHTSLPLEDDEVPERHAGGFLSDGTAAEASTLAAYAPAGGIHATLGDLAAFAEAVIDGPLTGTAAQTDLIDSGDGGAIGYFWGISDEGGSRIIGHNGMTAGFSSVLKIDTTSQLAVIVLSNQAESVDDVGALLLASADVS